MMHEMQSILFTYESDLLLHFLVEKEALCELVDVLDILLSLAKVCLPEFWLKHLDITNM
jgi:hypothetical protein